MRYRDELDPAQGLEGFDHGIEPPARSRSAGSIAYRDRVYWAKRRTLILFCDRMSTDGPAPKALPT